MKEEFTEDDLIKYRLKKGRDTLFEAKEIAKAGFTEACINRLYYACYYTATAILFQNNINPKTHAGVRQMLGLHFVETGKITKESGSFYSDLFVSRQAVDYEDFFVIDKNAVPDLIEGTEKFISDIEKIIYPNTKD